MRGIALYGSLAVNISAFFSPYYGPGLLPHGGRSDLDTISALAVSVIFELPFYLLFLFLFG